MEIDFDKAIEAHACVFERDPAIRHEVAIKKRLPEFRLSTKREQTCLWRVSESRSHIHEHLVGSNDVLNLAQIPTRNLANESSDRHGISSNKSPARRTEKVERLSAAFAGINRKHLTRQHSREDESAKPCIDTRERAESCERHNLIARQQPEATKQLK